LNLLINAAHAIPEGCYEDNEIRVRTWQEGGEVFAEVRDTGRGISAATHGNRRVWTVHRFAGCGSCPPVCRIICTIWTRSALPAATRGPCRHCIMPAGAERRWRVTNMNDVSQNGRSTCIISRKPRLEDCRQIPAAAEQRPSATGDGSIFVLSPAVHAGDPRQN
jgi:hypothetical protein